jgi:hypothetical protein
MKFLDSLFKSVLTSQEASWGPKLQTTFVRVLLIEAFMLLTPSVRRDLGQIARK